MELGRKEVQPREAHRYLIIQDLLAPLALFIVQSCCVTLSSCLIHFICRDLPVFLVLGKNTNQHLTQEIYLRCAEKWIILHSSQFLFVKIHLQAQRSCGVKAQLKG